MEEKKNGQNNSIRESNGSHEPLIIAGDGSKADEGNQPSQKDPSRNRDKSRSRSSLLFTNITVYRFSDMSKEFAIYLVFVFLYCAVIYMPRNSVPYQQQKAVMDTFIDTEFEPGLTYRGITSASQWYSWMESLVVPNLFPDKWYNGDALNTTEEQLMTTFGAYRFGVSRIRIQRVQVDSCTVYERLEPIAPSCYPSLTKKTQDTSEWLGITFQTRDETLSTSYYSYGTDKEYDGSGYVINLPANLTQSLEIVNVLRANDTLDSATRLALVEFNLYNPHVDFFIVGKFAYEHLASGFIRTSQVVRPVNLFNVYRVLTNNPTSHLENFNFALEMMFYFLVIMFIIIALKEIHEMGFKVWVSDAENTIEFTYLTLILVQMILRFILWSRIGNVAGDLLSKDSEDFAYVDKITWLVQQMDNITAVNAILFFGKTLTYLRANKTLRLFAHALQLAFTKVWSLLPIVAIVGSGFAVAFQLVFGRDVIEYFTWGRSLFTMFQAVVGDFDLQQLRYSNYYLGPLLFGIFIVFMFFVILSMFLSIVESALDETRNQMLMEKHVYHKSDDLLRDLNFLWGKFSAAVWVIVGKCRPKQQTVKVNPAAETDVAFKVKDPNQQEGEDEHKQNEGTDWRNTYEEIQTQIQQLQKNQENLLGLLDSTKELMDKTRK